MRTTLTIDDDVAMLLQKKAAQHGHSFKTVVNDLLRAGLSTTDSVSPQRKKVKVKGRDLGLRTGYDEDKLNQLVDQLEVDAFLKKQRSL